jgi:outer membrane protein TolC
MNRKILFLIMMLTCASAYAQQLFTLDSCKRLALRNNTKVQNARLSVAAAAETAKEAFAGYFPNVSAAGAGMIFSTPLMTQTVATGYPPPNDMAEVEIFKSGLIGGVTAVQPLFAGGQIVNGNRLARMGLEVSRLRQQVTDSEALLITERYFWQLVALKEKTKTVAEAETMLRRMQSDVKAAVDAGVATYNDLMRMELELNRLAASHLSIENGTNILKMAFGQHIGLDPDSFDIRQPDLADLALPDEKTDDSLALRHLPEYRLLEKSVDAARLQLKTEIGKNLPAVAIGAGYSHLYTDIGKSVEMEKKFGMIFATLSIPLSGWWGGSHAIKRKRIELQAAENTRRESAELLRLRMRQLASELDEACQQVILARKSIAVAEASVRLSENSYKAGISILSDLLDARNLLQQSRDRYVEAAAAYCLKRTEYRQATGQQE